MNKTSLSLVTAPTVLPVTLEEQKDHENIDFPDKDDLLTRYIEYATNFMDGEGGYLAMAIMNQVWDYKITGWAGTIPLPLPPTKSIEEVAYLDPNEGSPSEIIVDPSLYRLLPGKPAALYFKSGFGWPSPLAEPQNVRIRMNCGETDQASLDGKIKQAIQLLVAHWDTNKTDVAFGVSVSEIPWTVKALMEQIKVYR